MRVVSIRFQDGELSFGHWTVGGHFLDLIVSDEASTVICANLLSISLDVTTSSPK